MSFEMFGEHREITCTVIFRYFDFGHYNSSSACNLVMFNASDLLKGLLRCLL